MTENELDCADGLVLVQWFSIEGLICICMTRLTIVLKRSASLTYAQLCKGERSYRRST